MTTTTSMTTVSETVTPAIIPQMEKKIIHWINTPN